MEEWKLLTWNQRYETSNYGRIRNSRTHKVLKPYITKTRKHPRVTLRGGVFGKETYTISQIIYNEWCLRDGETPSYYQSNGFMVKGNRIAHRDGDVTNLRATNLYRY